MSQKIEKLLVTLADFLNQNKLTIILFTTLITVAFGASLQNLKIENKPGRFDLPADDIVRVKLQEFQELFGAAELILMSVSFNKPLTHVDLLNLHELSKKLETIEGINSALSVTNAVTLKWIPSFIIHTLRPSLLYLPTKVRDSSSFAKFLEQVRLQPAALQSLMSDDERVFSIVIEVQRTTDLSTNSIDYYQRIVASINSFSDSLLPKYATYRITGTPLMAIAFQEVLVRDLALFGPLSLITFALLLFLFLRSWKQVGTALLVAVQAVTWNLGWLSVTGTAVSMGLAVIVPLIFSISLAYSIHYLKFFYSKMPSNEMRITVFKRTVIKVFPPTLLTAITTALGFALLGLSDLEGIREVGYNTTFGVLSCLFLNSIFLPVMFLYVTSSDKPKHSSNNFDTWLPAFIGQVATKRASLIAFVAIIVATVAAVGIPMIVVETNHLHYFNVESPIRKDIVAVDSAINGILPLEITISLPTKNLGEIAPLIWKFEEELRQVNGIGSVFSAVDIIKFAQESKPQGVHCTPVLNFANGQIPKQVWIWMENASSGQTLVKSADSLSTLRISSRMHVRGSATLSKQLVQVRNLIEKYLPGEEVTVTGMTSMLVKTSDYVISTQIKSFTLAFIVVVIILFVLSGRILLGVLLIGTNVLPVVCGLGLMGWMGVPLDISTVMIASIALGIVVDDSIHFVYNYRTTLPADGAVSEKIQTTLNVVGLPIFATTVILATGFAVIGMSEFVPTSYFGIFSCIIIILAGATDILLLPALLHLVSKNAE